ncbi:RNA-directed DNA polymerase from mobile element jockey [Trichonephila clavipes]|nr:RNA-directed DNA polymerase from mobile element jockey [Trichonephila clavipes]
MLNLNIAYPPTPTRFGYNSANTIDIALIKNFYYPFTINSIDDLSSDHNPVFLNFSFKLAIEPLTPERSPPTVNKILKFNHFPENWKEAIIFPINKPGKDPHLATSYRPISLLSTIGKLTESIILLRLKNFINSNNLLNPNQYGFTTKLSTLHPLLRLTEHISEGFRKRKARARSFWISRKPSTVFGLMDSLSN